VLLAAVMPQLEKLLTIGHLNVAAVKISAPPLNSGC